VSKAEALDFLKAAGVAGTIFESTGYHPEWGAEPGVTFEFTADGATGPEVFSRGVLIQKGESAAYVTYDGRRAVLL
jgi:hypothetical protein